MTDTQCPTVGRIVHYVLSEHDVAHIDEDAPAVVNGRQVRNSVSVGDIYPAVVARVFDPASTTANLVVQLDGTSTYWATSRQAGADDEPGRWHWPVRWAIPTPTNPKESL